MKATRRATALRRQLDALDETVTAAAQFFRRADENHTDGYQTTRQVISHLVFWHREYVRTCRALARGQMPCLRSGKFRELDALAYKEFEPRSLDKMADDFVTYQESLAGLLRRHRNGRGGFPIKAGGKFCAVQERLPMIESHIRNHVARLARASRRQ